MMRDFLNYFGLNKDPILGLEISSTAIKLLELSRSDDHYRVEAFAYEPLKPGTIVERNIKDKGHITEVIKHAYQKSQALSKNVAVAVPNAAAITRVIQLSNHLKEKDIVNEIELEADRYIPYSLEEVNLDFEILGASEKNADMYDVLLAATKTENVEDRVEVINGAGLKAKVVDVEMFAAERAFELLHRQLPGPKEGKIIALVDLGATTTTINIFENRKMIYTREQVFGGQQLLDEIETRYSLSQEEALMARKYGELPDDYHTEVLEPFKEATAQQINRACQFFLSTGKYKVIDCVLLCGGTSAISGIENTVQDYINIKTFSANPFMDMDFSPKINQEILMNEASSLINCCGLAMRNFN